MATLRELFAEVPALKRSARTHYIAYQRIVDGMDCGRAMAETISRDATIHKIEFNAIMDKLSALDSSCPTTRL